MNLFETEFLRGKSQPITTEMVDLAFRKVKSNDGAAGVDGKDMRYMTEHKVGELYKLWNRMASGSYYPKAVRAVEIPKADGNMRLLGNTDHIGSDCPASSQVGNRTDYGRSVSHRQLWVQTKSFCP